MANTDWQVGSQQAHSDDPTRQYTLVVANPAAETQFENDYIAKHIGKYLAILHQVADYLLAAHGSSLVSYSADTNDNLQWCQCLLPLC